MDSCPICKWKATVTSLSPSEEKFRVECGLCGTFTISDDAFADIGSNKPEILWLLSAVVRNRSEQGEDVYITNGYLEHFPETFRLPQDLFERLDLLLEHIARRQGDPHNYIKIISGVDFPLLYVTDPKAFEYYLDKADELGYLEIQNRREFGDEMICRLSLKGWERLDEIKKAGRKSNQAFVAMCFEKSLTDVWENGIKVALSETGYTPIRIDLTEHNEKICDRIIAEIRKSALVVADFTGQRGGVYFEAGFAKGLGIPVIWTCREDEVSNLHFDTRQYFHIAWTNADDLRKRLKDRIEATLPKPGKSS